MAHGYLREYDEDWERDEQRERGQREPRGFMFGSDSERAEDGRRNRRFRSHPDDHYLSWRDKQIEALDRDYADYCRERERQFHREFDSWRQQRSGNPGPLRTGMTQTGLSADPSGLTQAERDNEPEQTVVDPMNAATLGTTPRSRGRR